MKSINEIIHFNVLDNHTNIMYRHLNVYALHKHWSLLILRLN